MPLFKINNNRLAKLKSESAKLEKNLQNLIENNLELVLQITFLATEYITNDGGRIDSLGIDNDGSPVIIEYKRDRNETVINQAIFYYGWVVKHKAEFEKLCISKKVTTKVDWSSPRIICVAKGYTKYDYGMIDTLALNIELFRYVIFDDNLLYLEQDSTNKRSLKIKQQTISKNPITEQIEFTIETHTKIASPKILELFNDLQEWIKNIDSEVIEVPRAYYIAYKLNTNFVDIAIQKNSMKLVLNIKSGELIDSKNIARDLTKPKKIGHHGNGDYDVKVDLESDIEYIKELIIQSYNWNK
jgi:predicted transport protein